MQLFPVSLLLLPIYYPQLCESGWFTLICGVLEKHSSYSLYMDIIPHPGSPPPTPNFTRIFSLISDTIFLSPVSYPLRMNWYLRYWEIIPHSIYPPPPMSIITYVVIPLISHLLSISDTPGTLLLVLIRIFYIMCVLYYALGRRDPPLLTSNCRLIFLQSPHNTGV